MISVLNQKFFMLNIVCVKTQSVNLFCRIQSIKYICDYVELCLLNQKFISCSDVSIAYYNNHSCIVF